ncbi:P63C domain-containing protein [Lichenifustis flavocetrariae]|uniref:P63C domain-containing protein n=1 Tax=Lichenifustis flavocetrariae TaxID=2949735 RepID=A0AA42CMK3_9HYPH|nr:P63C domain-containing protein [Lichenifustis flavocetrariae]MCW6512633.1 P63C domain-containing protein [Lichenifustis flavocetrariae]
MVFKLKLNGSKQSKGGRARAEALTPEKRQEIARAAAVAKHAKAQMTAAVGMPKAVSQGSLPIGDTTIDVYVLEDRRRLIHKRGIARALGLRSAGGNAFMKTISRKGLGSAISPELLTKIENPIEFIPLNGDPAHGYPAEVFIEVCDAIMSAARTGKLAQSQHFLGIQAEFIVRSAAKIGIIGLIDEATGFIADKRREEYRDLWTQFIRDECRAYEAEFPEKFFDSIYRLYGLKRKDPKSFRHPQFFGKFIRKYVYAPLANSKGAILEELDAKNPVVYANGGRRYKMFQFLSDEIGMPAVKGHLWQVVGIAASSSDKAAYDRAFYRAFPEALPLGSQGNLLDGLDDEA